MNNQVANRHQRGKKKIRKGRRKPKNKSRKREKM